MDGETKAVWILIIITVVGIAAINFGYIVPTDSGQTDKKIFDFKNQNHLIKEMSVDMITSGSVSGGFLLIGGTVYGSIDQERIITVIYGTPKDGLIIYKTVSIPITDIEFVTVDKSVSPSLKIINGISRNIDTFDYDITRARLYLPDGWTILK